MHARAARDRWWEEVVLLKEELRRVGESFLHRAAEWQSTADAARVSKQTRVTRGVRAYALRQAAIYNFLAADAQNRYQNVLEPYQPKLFGNADGNNKGTISIPS